MPSSVSGAPPRTKAAQREQTVAALVSRARELFAGHGYSEVSLAEIVTATGVTKGALYHHFPGGKEDLFRAVVIDVIREVAAQIRGSVAGTDPWTQLVVGCRTFLEASTEPGVHQILLIDAPSVLGWSQWSELDSATLMKGLIRNLDQLVTDGTFREDRVEPLAHLLAGAMNEAALWIAYSDNRDGALDEVGATLAELLESYKDKESKIVDRGSLVPRWSPSRVGHWLGEGDRRWWFDPGSLALDFAYTGSMPRTTEEWTSPSGLKGWVEQRFQGTVAMAKGDLEKAKELRDALAAVFIDQSHGRKLNPEAVALINRVASGEPVAPRLGQTPKATFDQGLVAVAQEGVATLNDHGDRVRRCVRCDAVFVDRSVAGGRQLCAWNRCGLER